MAAGEAFLNVMGLDTTGTRAEHNSCVRILIIDDDLGSKGESRNASSCGRA